MSVWGNIAKAAFIPEGESEKFTFKKFDGKELRKYALTGDPYPSNKIEVVILKINPSDIKHDQPRMTQKIQTNYPGRFIIFDWGVDLHTMTISGHTGNLLPDIVQNQLDPSKPIVDYINSKITSIGGLNSSVKNALALGTDALLANLSYFEILGMSQKYKTFTKLQTLYLGFDADRDVCTLEFGEFIYRIFFVNFNFTQSADSPWDWTYEITLNVLSDLTEFARKGDGEFNNNSKNVDITQ